MYDLKYKALERFDTKHKCSKCDMCTTEVVSYEYDEWENYCLNGKNLEEDGYCFIPLFVSKIKAKLFKEKILKQQEDEIADSFAEWMEEQERIKEEKTKESNQHDLAILTGIVPNFIGTDGDNVGTKKAPLGIHAHQQCNHKKRRLK